MCRLRNAIRLRKPERFQVKTLLAQPHVTPILYGRVHGQRPRGRPRRRRTNDVYVTGQVAQCRNA